jgi:hypothetical protein
VIGPEPSLRTRIERRGSPSGDRLRPALVTWIGTAVSVILALLSDGAYHDDGLTHYLFARWAWSDPHYLLNEWGRPGLTLLLFPFAAVGWPAAKVCMAVVSGVAVWLAYRSAVRLRLRTAEWVPLLCFVQPVFLVMSYDTMTESAMAFYLVLGLWLHLTRRPGWGAAAVSLCFVTRYESSVLLAVWAVGLWRARAGWTAFALLLWTPVTYNLLGLLLGGRLPLLYFGETPQLAAYGAGNPLTMLVRSMASWGPAVCVLALVGCLESWRVREGWMVSVSVLAYLVTHSLVYWLGTHGSGGYPRFLVAVTPLVGIAAANGLERLADAGAFRRRAVLVLLVLVVGVLCLGAELEGTARDEAWIFLLEKVRPVVRILSLAVIALGLLWWARLGRAKAGRPVTWPAGVLAVLAVVATMVPLVLFVRPHRLGPDARAVRAAVGWIEAREPASRTVVATTVWASYFLDRGYSVVPPDRTPILDEAEPGTLLLWDAEYSPGERFGLTLDAMAGHASAWRLVWTSPARDRRDPFVRVYQCVRGGS